LSPAVFISSEHGLCQAMLFESPEVPSPPSKAASRRKTSHDQAQSTEIHIDRSAVNSILERAFELTRGIQIVPEFKDGSTIGMRVFGVHTDSLLAALGIENGDRIERLNGTAISTPEAALSVYGKLQSAERVGVELNRLGRPFRIDIRVD